MKTYSQLWVCLSGIYYADISNFNAKGPGNAQVERKGGEPTPSMAADETGRGALPIANEVTSTDIVRNGGVK